MSGQPRFVNPFHSRTHSLAAAAAAAAPAGKAKLTHPGKAILAGNNSAVHASVKARLLCAHVVNTKFFLEGVPKLSKQDVQTTLGTMLHCKSGNIVDFDLVRVSSSMK